MQGLRASSALFIVSASLIISTHEARACGAMMISPHEQLESNVNVKEEPVVYFTAPEVTKHEEAVNVNALSDAMGGLLTQFGYCYDDLLRRRPDALTVEKFKFDVNKDGAVKKAKLSRSRPSVKDDSFEACLDAAARDWTVSEAAYKVKRAFSFSTSFQFAPPRL